MSTLLPLVLHQQRGGAASFTGDPEQYADYTVYVAWSYNGTGLIPYNDLTAQAGHGVKSARIRRGRDDALSSMQMGTATVVVHDPDGLYNPDNAASPLYGELRPMQPIAIYADNGGTELLPGHDGVLIFSGFIRSIAHDPRRGAQETVFECGDSFLSMGQSKPQFGSAPTIVPAGAFIETLLTTGSGIPAVYPPKALDVDPADGIDISRPNPRGDKTILEWIEEVLAADRGVFYCKADGAPHYEVAADRTARSSAATITDTMMALNPGVDLDRIGNRCRVTRIGGVQQVADDLTSQDLYGVRDIGDIESAYLEDDTAALDLAEYLVDQFKDPRSPMFALELMNRDADTMTQIIVRDLQDRITVVDNLGGTSGDYHIEGIEHEITEGGKWHRCKWILSARGTGTQTGHAGVIGAGVPDNGIPAYIAEGDSFPATANDGALAFYVADESAGVVWQFRYDGTAGEWRFVGGPPLEDRIDTDQSTTSGSFANLGTTGPSITIPLAGSYDIEVNCNAYANGVATVLMSYAIGGSAAQTADAAQAAIAATNYSLMLPSRGRHTGLSAGTTIVAKYATTAGTANFRYRRLSVTPVAVTGV